MAKWFSACLQCLIGSVHRLDASRIAMNTNFRADCSLGYCLRFLVNFRIALLSDSIALVVYVARRISSGKSNIEIMSVHLFRHCWEIVGYFASQTLANSSNCSSADA